METPLITNKNRRSRMDIISNIINLAQSGESKFKIREKAHLNAQQAKLYLEELTKLGLIEMKHVNGRNIYIASQTGNQFLKQYDTLKKLLTGRLY